MSLRKREGLFLVLSAPSGAGKTTLSSILMQKDSNLRRSISLTTRRPRQGEVDGKDYQFVSEKVFLSHCQEGLMLEHAKVFGNFYGTSGDKVRSMISDGYDVLCTIDWQGALQICEKMNCVSIFVLPPSLDELKNRLVKRNQDDQDEIRERIEQSKEEIAQYHYYDYVLVNDDVDKCVDDILAIIRSERLRISNQRGIVECRVSSLQSEIMG